MKLFPSAIICYALATHAQAQDPTAALVPDKTVPLPQVEGRIDHMALDVAGQRLFVAALGNNTLEVIDVRNARHVRTIPGLHEPQGVAYAPATNRIYVANRADGSLHIYDGNSFALVKIVAYGRDADNVRYEPEARHLWVGYGEGGL